MTTRPPVALFVYARPDHTRRTLDALAANNGATETNVTVFCDGSRGEEDRSRVEAVAAVVAEAKGFRSLKIVRRNHNIGLADNIISGVSEIVKQDGQVIVLEDDIETATGFLDYMGAALDRYRDDQQVSPARNRDAAKCRAAFALSLQSVQDATSSAAKDRAFSTWSPTICKRLGSNSSTNSRSSREFPVRASHPPARVPA